METTFGSARLLSSKLTTTYLMTTAVAGATGRCRSAAGDAAAAGDTPAALRPITRVVGGIFGRVCHRR